MLEVKYRGKSIYDVLEMTVDDAIAFFGEDRKDSTCKRIVERLKPLQDVGLGYIKLGQSSSTLSGGESQRVARVKPFCWPIKNHWLPADVCLWTP